MAEEFMLKMLGVVKLEFAKFQQSLLDIIFTMVTAQLNIIPTKQSDPFNIFPPVFNSEISQIHSNSIASQDISLDNLAFQFQLDQPTQQLQRQQNNFATTKQDQMQDHYLITIANKNKSVVKYHIPSCNSVTGRPTENITMLTIQTNPNKYLNCLICLGGSKHK